MAAKPGPRLFLAVTLCLPSWVWAQGAWDPEKTPWPEKAAQAQRPTAWAALARHDTPPPQSVGTLSLIAEDLVWMYQKTLSGRTGGRCQFYPSCSRYGRIALVRHGFFAALALTADRVSRCNSHAASQHRHPRYSHKGQTLLWNSPDDDAWWRPSPSRVPAFPLLSR